MLREDKRLKAGECGPCSPALRNRYFRGKLLTVADYEAEQRYMIGRRRMINRSVLGWGVVSGLSVTAEKGDLSVSAGIALDKEGREILLCEGIRICDADELLWLREGACDCGEVIDPAPGRYLLSAHYAERRIEGVRIDDGCGEASCEWNHLCETIVFVLTPIDECPCGRRSCLGDCTKPSDCELLKPGGGDPAAPPTQEEQASAWDDRGPHATLCEWNSDRLCDYDPCRKDAFCVQSGYWLDPAAGVPLACLTVEVGDCDTLAFAVERDCHPRRLVRSNDVLFDLIRGCDLTRIQAVGWNDASGTMTPDDFYELFITPADTDQQPAQRQKGRQQAALPTQPPVDTRFSVCFTAPVQIASLTPDVMAVTLIQRHPNERLGVVFRIPVVKLWILPTQKDDPDGTTRGFRVMVDWQFWDGEIKRSAVSGFERPTQVEIEIRGDFILDWRGQTVDANRAGRHRWPTGNGTPGGTFLSSFTVQYPPEDQTPAIEAPEPAQAN